MDRYFSLHMPSVLDPAPLQSASEQSEASMADISKHVDKQFEQMEFSQLADAPVDALQGLSKSDAEALQTALGIRTIRDLAENKFVRWAQGIVHMAHMHKGDR